jgi:hypothetical protein
LKPKQQQKKQKPSLWSRSRVRIPPSVQEVEDASENKYEIKQREEVDLQEEEEPDDLVDVAKPNEKPETVDVVVDVKEKQKDSSDSLLKLQKLQDEEERVSQKIIKLDEQEKTETEASAQSQQNSKSVSLVE